MWPLRKKTPVDETTSNIGEVLKKLGALTDEKLLEAVELQHQLKSAGDERKLGEVLVMLGHITGHELEDALDVQKCMREDKTTGLLRLADKQTDLAKRESARMTHTLSSMPAVAKL